MGSWTFVGLFILFMVAWAAVNTFLLATRAWDPDPFILLNPRFLPVHSKLMANVCQHVNIILII